MKKFLAAILSLVLVLTVVVCVACNSEAGGNNFKEVDLTDKETREQFVDALSEKVDTEALIGNPNEEGWTFGLEEIVTSNLVFDLSMTPAQDAVYKVKGNLNLNENVKAKLTSNGATKDPTVAAALTLSAKGNIELSDLVYQLIDGEISDMMGEEISIKDTVQSLITNFNYSVSAYADNEVILANISDSIYGKLPEDIQKMLGSSKIKLPVDVLDELSTYAVMDDSGSDLLGLNKEEVKQAINQLIDNVLLRYNISVSVATQKGYALRISANQQSILAILNDALADVDDASLVKTVKDAIGSDTKLELTIRVDENGAFSSISYDTSLQFNLKTTVSGYGEISASVSMSSSFALKKYSGAISKPDDKDYKLPAVFAE